MNIAILDDYQNVALEMADWSAHTERAEITVFNDHTADPSALCRVANTRRVFEQLRFVVVVSVARSHSQLCVDVVRVTLE